MAKRIWWQRLYHMEIYYYLTVILFTTSSRFRFVLNFLQKLSAGFVAQGTEHNLTFVIITLTGSGAAGTEKL